jgi:hypothetical protein
MHVCIYAMRNDEPGWLEGGMCFSFVRFRILVHDI